MFGVIWSTDYVNILFNISQTQNEATVRPFTIRKRDKKLPVLSQNLIPTRHGAEKNVTKSLSSLYSPKFIPYMVATLRLQKTATLNVLTYRLAMSPCKFFSITYTLYNNKFYLWFLLVYIQLDLINRNTSEIF